MGEIAWSWWLGRYYCGSSFKLNLKARQRAKVGQREVNKQTFLMGAWLLLNWDILIKA